MSFIYYFPEKYKISESQIDNIDVDNVKLMIPELRKCTITCDENKNKYFKFKDNSIIYRSTDLKHDKSITRGDIDCDCLSNEYCDYDHSMFFNKYDQSLNGGICGNCFMQRPFCFNNESFNCIGNCIRCGSNKWMTIKELNNLIIENNKFKFPSKKKKTQYIDFKEFKKLDKCEQCLAKYPIQNCHLCDTKLCENCRAEAINPDTGKIYRYEEDYETMYLCQICYSNQ